MIFSIAVGENRSEKQLQSEITIVYSDFALIEYCKKSYSFLEIIRTPSSKPSFYALSKYGFVHLKVDTTELESECEPPQTCSVDKEFMANNIYYDLNKCEIRPDAAIELDKIALIMLDNEEIRVEMGAHTDARASDEYNFLLSQKRAKAALDYLISKGVSKEKISAIGYGKTQLINNCKEILDCSEKEHQVNRRMEIKLIFEQEIPVKYSENQIKRESKEL